MSEKLPLETVVHMFQMDFVHRMKINMEDIINDHPDISLKEFANHVLWDELFSLFSASHQTLSEQGQFFLAKELDPTLNERDRITRFAQEIHEELPEISKENLQAINEIFNREFQIK